MHIFNGEQKTKEVVYKFNDICINKNKQDEIIEIQVYFYIKFSKKERHEKRINRRLPYSLFE